MKKLRVGVVFGGRSTEHEVSVRSAVNVVRALDPEKYDVVLIAIDHSGRWYLSDVPRLHETRKRIDTSAVPGDTKALAGEHSGNLVSFKNEARASVLVSMKDGSPVGPIDVVFPVIHGTNGEDGTLQGFLKLMNVPFVGAGVLGSAVGMDKDVMKRLMRDAGLPVPKFVVRSHLAMRNTSFDDIARELGTPFFVKPANSGSSVGIHKVKERSSYDAAVADALSYDTKLIFEEAIVGREIECSVLGNDEPIASVPGEIIPTHEFYSYDAKYLDENGAGREIPAKIQAHVAKNVQELAVRAFQALNCEGMARVDFFLTPDESLVVNEINTIPGFTDISMYPSLWNASGISTPELIDRLIRLALERFEREQALKRSVD